MKYIVLLCDGMADLPSDKLGGKTPMELAFKPNMDSLFKKCAVYGTVKTVPDSLNPGSDVANLGVMGYDAEKYYTGRSPLEAVSMGIKLGPDDIAFRVNLVTLSDENDFSGKTMIDYCGGDISTKEAVVLIEYLKEKLPDKIKNFKGLYSLTSGISYRHCLVAFGGTVTGIPSLLGFSPPHDFIGKPVKPYISSALENFREFNSCLLEIMKEAHGLLKNHPVNLERVSKGLNPANAIWMWGAGGECDLPDFEKKTGLKGAVVSAVDLLKGIAGCAGMKAISAEGFTGYIDTDFEGKAQAAVDALKNGYDYVYIHIEAPDECGHRGEYEKKVKSIEIIDKIVLNRLVMEFETGVMKGEDCCLLICPDHPTPLDLMTHTRTPVPFFIYRKGDSNSNGGTFTEKTAESGVFVNSGEKLAEMFLK